MTSLWDVTGSPDEQAPGLLFQLRDKPSPGAIAAASDLKVTRTRPYRRGGAGAFVAELGAAS